MRLVRPGGGGGADAEHDRPERDQQAGVADADLQSLRQFAQHARRRQNGGSGDEISEHQGGGREAALDMAVVRRIFHANACTSSPRERKARNAGYFLAGRGPLPTAILSPFESAGQRL